MPKSGMLSSDFHTSTVFPSMAKRLFMKRMKASVDSLFLLLGECAPVSFSKGTLSQALGQSSDAAARVLLCVLMCVLVCVLVGS